MTPPERAAIGEYCNRLTRAWRSSDPTYLPTPLELFAGEQKPVIELDGNSVRDDGRGWRRVSRE